MLPGSLLPLFSRREPGDESKIYPLTYWVRRKAWNRMEWNEVKLKVTEDVATEVEEQLDYSLVPWLRAI